MRLSSATSVLLAVVAAAACGPNNEVIADDSLAPPPREDDTSSSGGRGGSSSGTAAPSSSGSSTGDAGVGVPQDAGVDAEAGPHPPRTCDPAAALGPSVIVPGLAGASSPSFSADELRAVYIVNAGDAGLRVYESTRPTTLDTFANPVDLGLSVVLGPPYGGVALSDDARAVYYTSFDATIHVNVVTRADLAAPFGPPATYHEGAYSDVTARDGSARFSSVFDGASFGLYQQRPAAAAATLLLPQAFLSWYDAPSGNLWFTQYLAVEGNPIYLPEVQHWNGAAWDPAENADLLVTWSSPDACRVYGFDGANVVVRSRPLPP